MIIESQSATALEQRIHQLEAFIGKTPLYKINHVFQKPGVTLYAKLEWLQLGGSVKARPAFNIIKTAIEQGQLDQNRTFLDATSGNTGIAYAHVCAALGIPLTICMPENATRERKEILTAFGAELVFTPAEQKTTGSQRVAREMYEANPDKYFLADQYSNDANWLSHFHHTATEIMEQTEGKVTHFATGLGTTGTFVGTARGLKHLKPEVTCIALEPSCPDHGLPGWKHLATAKIPSIYDETLPDGIMSITLPESQALLRDVARYEGLLISPSAAANLAGAIKVAESIDEGVVVTVFPDDASKYSDEIRDIFAAG